MKRVTSALVATLAAVLVAGVVRRGDRGFSRAVQFEALLIIAAIAEWKLGIDAEGKSLESIADPLSR